MNDLLQRFIFEDADIRGEITRLEHSYQDILSNHQYPEVVAHLLGEFLAAATLLSATLKFEGTLTLQARSQGEIPLIMAEASSNHTVRAIARDAELASSDHFQTLLADGQLSITIDPKQGRRYQGIVSLDGHNLAACLEAYFQQSEQLSTRIWLTSNGQTTAGMLLQELPSSHSRDIETREQQWQHMLHLADTLTPEELLSLSPEELLYRLYHQEQVRVFPAVDIAFACSCSEERTLSALVAMGEQELRQIIAEQAKVEVNCEFCHQHYSFDQKRIDELFKPQLH